MINLLPPDTKQEITFARRNSVLRNWLLAIVVGFAGILLVIGGGLFFIVHSTDKWEKQVTAADAQLKQQKLQETQTRVKEMSESIKLASDVLSSQVLFSKLLSQVTTVLPSRALLQSLTIQSVSGGIDLTVGAKDYQSATQAQINLADPNNKVFEKADIVNINCQTEDPDNEYPCTATIRALFAKDNTFQYSSTAKGSTP